MRTLIHCIARIRGKTGFSLSEETKKKIGLANKGIWIKYNCDYCNQENEKKQSHYRLQKNNVLRSRTESIQLAALQGKMSSNKGVKKPLAEQWKQNISKARLKWSKINAKKTRINRNGYVEYTTGKNVNRTEHVVLMEEKIARKLYHNECVHHINHIKTDNSIKNLQLMTKKEYSKLHAMEKIKKISRNSKGQFIKYIYEC